jgi:hypothetical protein
VNVAIVLVQANRDLREARVDLRGSYQWGAGLPELDVLVLEWRWPLPGRNTSDCGMPGHMCDLHRQAELVEHFTLGRGTPTVVWDLDQLLPAVDPLRESPNVRVAEYALRPNPAAFTLACPVPDLAPDNADAAALARVPRDLSLV